MKLGINLFSYLLNYISNNFIGNKKKEKRRYYNNNNNKS